MGRMVDRLNRLDERIGADRVGQGMRLYGILVAWPWTAVVAFVGGVRMVIVGEAGLAVFCFVFAGLAGLFVALGLRGERSYRRYRASQQGSVTGNEPVFLFWLLFQRAWPGYALLLVLGLLDLIDGLATDTSEQTAGGAVMVTVGLIWLLSWRSYQREMQERVQRG